MGAREFVQRFVPEIDSPQKIYDLFRRLGYPGDKVLDPTYKRKIKEFDFAKEEQEKVKEIYTVFTYESKLQIFLIETSSISPPFVRYLTKHLSDRYLRFLLILTPDYKAYSFVFPELELIEEGKHKLKLTRLNLDRGNLYHTDLFTISSLALTGKEENWRDIWNRWKDAFAVEKVTDRFFEDYKTAFFKLRQTFEEQKISIKKSHELAQQFLNRLMFLYFISRKRWLYDNPKFIRWYWDRYKEEKRSGRARENTFYENWLRILFLEAFNNQYTRPHFHPQDVRLALADAPYLNGGLFHRTELDDLPFHIHDSLFEEVFNFLEQYNFTIREELPLDVEVAVDPQMIGYVYESLANVAEEIYERQDLGIFFTPTIEVDFMCRRSLVEYLLNHIASPSLTVHSPLVGEGQGEGYHLNKEWIYRLLFDEDKKDVERYIERQGLWYRLEEVLDNLAVVDPACGSGAFLVGMLHVLVELYRFTYNHIEREMSDFELKKKIIGNSLYGVDVMPWAVHSAELRLWLQLIIEGDIPPAERKLYPLLPNLNLKLRDGDSLVQEIGGINLHIRDAKISPPNKLRGEVSTEDKKDYKEKLLRSIQAHFPFIQRIDKKSYYYIYFYFHGLSLLNDKGTFCFITSNSWLDVGYGRDLQEFLLRYCHIKGIYDNQARRSFEHADVNTIIALLGPPKAGDDNRGGSEWNALEETARFVMFKKPFEEAVNTRNLLEIERADHTKNTDAYRVFPINQETLLEEGCEAITEIPANRKIPYR